MSDYKEGEGRTKFAPIIFTSAALATHRDWQVLLIGDNEVLLTEIGRVGECSPGQDVEIEKWARHGQFQLTFPDGLFLTYPVETFDIILRVNGLAAEMFPNIQTVS